jgi:AAA15 family ATPase/GTPase
MDYTGFLVEFFISTTMGKREKMLIEFTVQNFLSISEKQVFSMNATKNKELDENVIKVDAPANLELLRSSVIYGPNAAGKTNFMLSLRKMVEIVVESASTYQNDEALPIQSFKLDPEFENSPSEFETSFIIDNVRYQYGFSATFDKIHDEWLFAYPKGRPQRWFARAWDNEKNEYAWDMGNYLLGEKQVWQNATRENALFLSTAVQLNSKQLAPIFNFFKNKLRFSNVVGWSHNYSAKLCTEDMKDNVLRFLKAADVGIDDISVTKEKFDPSDLPEDMPMEVKKLVLDKMKDTDKFDIKTFHKNKNGKLIEFRFGEESDGTQKLFNFAGPWINSLEKGYILFIDELHDNLHPKLVKFLVGLFNNPLTNPNNAQLVFTTHETSILNQNTFRRDQIWFCEKDEGNSTRIYPLTDFSPRKGRESLEAAYLDGRYGALPFIKDLEVL